MPNENGEHGAAEPSRDDGSPTEPNEAAAGAAEMSRAEADRSMADARKLFEVARWVHARRVVGGVDSAIFAHRALTRVLGVLVRVNGDPVPEDFAALVERAKSIAKGQSLLEDGAGEELAVIDEMRERAGDPRDQASPADERRYDRAFVKSGEWVGAVQAYVDQRLPKPKTSLMNSLIVVVVIVLAFAIGVVVGQRSGAAPPAPATEVRTPGPVAATASAAVGPAFEAKFYSGTTFGELLLSRRDSTISFDWEHGSPGEGVPLDNFSARWEGRLNVGEPGKYTFLLTSDDGSRLFIDDALVVDNWGEHAELMRGGVAELDVREHAVRVEYFDRIGGARIRLEWSSDRFERRLIGTTDLR